MKEYDVVVIGAGPGGYQCAIDLGNAGIKTLLIDRTKENVGGVCLNVGCIPTKNYLESANFLSRVPYFKECGLDLEYNGFDIKKLKNQTIELKKEIRTGVLWKLEQANVELLYAEASFIDEQNIKVDGETISYKKCVIATGSKPREFENLPFDSKYIISSSDVFDLETLPKSITIIGTGAIGCEFSTFFNSVGVEVTLIGRSEYILSKEDEDVSKALMRVFKRININVITSAEIKDVNITSEGVELSVYSKDNEEVIKSELILVASGRVANIDSLNLEQAGVELDENGYVKVNDSFVTSKKNIFSIGDCIDTTAFAHTAYKEAQIVAKNIINSDFKTNPHISPSTIFTTPQIASCGLNEKSAKVQGTDIEIKKAYYKVNAKAKIHGDDSGFAKVIICADTNIILGATIIGVGASEIIHELVFCVEKKLTIDELRDVVHAHPTLSEIITYL